jgi:hypothetical protein
VSSWKKVLGKAFNIDETNDQIRQRSSEKFVGCKFLVKIIRRDGEGQEIEVHVNPHHNGYEPGLQSDANFYQFIIVQKRIAPRC